MKTILNLVFFKDILQVSRGSLPRNLCFTFATNTKKANLKSKTIHSTNMSSKTVICLFRNDFRVHDNEALYLANQKAVHLVPLFCFDPRHFGETYHFGQPKTGSHRMKFLLESIQDLRKTLKAHGSDLIVRVGKPETIVADILKSTNAEKDGAVVFHKEVTDEELKVETAIEAHVHVPVIKPWGHTLYHIDDLPFNPKNLPDVYTEFRKRVENQTVVRKCFKVPDTLKPLPPGLDAGKIPSSEELGMPVPPQDPHSAFPFPGGETTALERLNSYLFGTDNVSTYKETRNGMIGADYSTKFSPWLAHGCLSPRQIYWEIMRYEKERTANQSTYWVIFELIWRDYFRYVGIKYKNRLFHSGGIKGDKVKWKVDMNQYKAWKEGKTGVPYIDANMRELKATGFMSNRGRQNVASFLVKDLHLDWRLGAEWFESMLIDHDVTSNYGNWLYSAGIGNDPRENRKFNVIKQGLDYDAQGEYVRLWVPELAGVKTGSVHCVWTLSPQMLEGAGISLGDDYPKPIVIDGAWGKHVNRPGASGSARGARGQGGQGGKGSARGRRDQGSGQQRGMDFYFSHGSNK